MDKQIITVTTIRSLLAQDAAAQRHVDLAFKFHFGHDGRRTVRGPRISSERYGAAQGKLSACRALLEGLILAAEWGAQDNGRVFVTRRSGWPHNSSTYVSINVDGLTVLSGEVRWDRESGEDEVWNLQIHDVAAERADRERRRAASRAIEVEQAAIRARLADDLRRGRVPRGVEDVDGQRGGYLVVGERSSVVWQGSGWAARWVTEMMSPGTRIAIRGVLKAAGIDPGEHPYTTWTETIADLRSHEPEARVRARQLPPRVRHMRAAEVQA